MQANKHWNVVLEVVVDGLDVLLFEFYLSDGIIWFIGINRYAIHS